MNTRSKGLLLCAISAIAAMGAGLPRIAKGGESRPVVPAADVRRVVNIVNFVRALDPRRPKSEHLHALREEVALNLKHGFENTILLQYDALVDAEMIAEARRSDPAKTEFGLWFEMSRPLNETAGLEWRPSEKHKGWDWDWFINPGFLMAYDHDGRRRLIDAAFAKFKAEFGSWPKSVGSWLLDAWSMDYMVKTYGVDGFCICREQDSTDAYGLRGGYSNGAYYPSRKNMLSAAVDMENAVQAPVFKMLTPDPIYNYGLPHELYPGYPHRGGCPTMEPVWYGGHTQAIVDWYFRVYTEPKGLLNLSYMQTGQENAFGWPMISKGLPMQCVKIAAEAAAGRIVVEKMCDTARAFKAAHKSNCPQTQIALEDWTGAGRKSVWYNSRFYRANLVMEGSRLFFRDIHKMSDEFEEPFLDKVCTGWQALYYTPPVVDQWLFRGEGATGTMSLAGEFKSLDTSADGGVLAVTATRADGAPVEIRFEEGRVVVGGCGLDSEYAADFRKALSIGGGAVDFEFRGYRYCMPVHGKLRATEKGFSVDGDRIELDLSTAKASASTSRPGHDPYCYKELVAREIAPEKVYTNAAGRAVADFGKDAAGWLELDGPDSGPYEIVVGELVNRRGEVANEFPNSSIRCQRLAGVKPSGKYRVPMPEDKVNLKGYDPKAPAIRLPDRFGVVFPFRYAEIEKGPMMTLRQFAVNYPIDMGKSGFSCDCADLERVYEFCKYSILATSFCGVYVDGDRERTPYEADAYINQLGHYAIDDDCSLARKSHEWLMEHPTWPTEWRQHSIMMAWADWMWTGDTRSVAKYYDMLVGDKLMLRFARASDGLLETGGERGKGAKPGASDIVDWPPCERDGFVFRPVNAVVNAFFYRNLREMADISAALGKDERAAKFADMAENVRRSFQRAFYRADSGLYADGEGTDHCSLHANAAALAFGLVPEGRVAAIADFLERKGLACSVYFAQYLLEALFKAGRDEAAVRLMASHGDRSWLGMLDFGSTVTMEAWNVAAKPNLDLNHAWGAAPLNIISRYVVGVTPLEPGFRKIAIRPQLGGLKRLSATVPTVAGPVAVKVENGILEYRSPSPAVVNFAGGLTHAR